MEPPRQPEELKIIGGQRRQPVSRGGHGLCRKGSAAAAILLGVRIIEFKTGLHQRLFIIERHAVQKNHTLGIDKNLYVFKLENLVGGSRLRIELELIAQTRTTASEHTKPKAFANALLGESLPDLANRLGCYINHR